MAATEISEQDARPIGTEAHTPTPWAVCDNPPNDQWFAGLTIFCPAEGKRVADTSFLDSRSETNAAFIVRAVNAHDDLVKALETIGEADSSEDSPRLARAALAKAKGAA